MIQVIFLVSWLVVGYLFARWFVNSFLDDHKWADCGEGVGPLTLIGLTFAGPAMGLLMAVMYGGAYVMENYSTAIKRFYGVK